MRKVVLTPSDFGMFDTDINSVEFEFFQKHKEAFKRMWIEQGKKFWIQFVITFRQFAADYGVIKEFPAKNEHFEDCIDQGFIIIHETFVDGKFTTARNFIMDIVMVAQNRHTLQYLESKSYAKDPFYNKETRDVFRRLFGSPTEKASYVKVYVLLPLYMKYGGAVCICLRRWLEAEDCVDMDIANPLTNGSNKTLQTKECNKKPRTIQDSVKTKHSSEINNSVDDGKQMKNKKKRSDQGNNTLEMVEIDESKEQRSAKKDMKQKKDSSTLTNINNGDDGDDDFPTDKAEALKKLEDISKDFVDSMHSHPCIRSSTMTLEVNEGKEKRSSVYHLDKGMAGEEERMQAMEEAEEKFRRAMREEEYNDDFFKMYIEEITKGSTKGPVHVPGWPEEKDPRFYDSDNPLYDPDSKKEEWKSNLRLPDFQKFVRYAIEEYVKGPKGEMASIAARFDLKEPTFVVGRDVCSSKRSPNCLSKNTPEEIARKQEMDKLAKQEEEKRKKIEDERKRQKKIRKKLKKGLPLNAEELSSTTSMKLASSSESNQDSGTSSKCKLSNPHDTCSQEKVSPLEESPDPRKPYIMDDKAKEKHHEPKLLEKEKMKEGEKNSMKFTKKVDEKAGTVSLTIEKRDDKGRLTKETTVKPISEDGKIWDEAVKRIAPEAMMNKPPPVLKDEVQKELAQKLSKNNYFEDKKSGEESSKTPEGVNSTNTWLTGDEMQDQDKKQFREMYHEISAAIADVSRQNQAEEEGKTYCTANETRQEKARNRLRRKIGEKKPERKNAELPGLLRLCGNVEYPQNEREAMMLTLAEMTKMNPREKELFQERLGRTKYFRDCQEDPRDVADSMGACLFPGIKKTLTDSKSKKKKERVREDEKRKKKEAASKPTSPPAKKTVSITATIESPVSKATTPAAVKSVENKEEALCLDDVKTVIQYKDDVKKMKEELHYNNIRLKDMMAKQKDNKKESVKTGREFDDQVKKAWDDLKILEQKIAILDRENETADNPDFNASVVKASEELRAVKKKVEKWEADADVLNHKIDRFEKEGDVNALLDGEHLIEKDCIDEADQNTHSDLDELDYKLARRDGPIDQEKAFEDFKSVMGLEKFDFVDDNKSKTIKKDKQRHSKSPEKPSKMNQSTSSSSPSKAGKSEEKKKSDKGSNVYLEINERVPGDFQCKIPGCACHAKSSGGHPPAGEAFQDGTLKFIQDIDSGVLPPPPPGVSITVLQRVTEPIDGVKPKCAINMGPNNSDSKEFKSYWKAAKSYGPTPPEKMLQDPEHCNLVITNPGIQQDPMIKLSDFGPSKAKMREKHQIKVVRDKPVRKERNNSNSFEHTEKKSPQKSKKNLIEKSNNPIAKKSVSEKPSPDVNKKNAVERKSPPTMKRNMDDNAEKLIENVKEQKAEKAEGEKKSSKSSKQLKSCSACEALEPAPKAFKKCQKCKVDAVKAARYYCGKECQVSDWKARHRQQHSDGSLQ